MFLFKSIFEIIRWIDLSLGQERHSLGAVYMFLSVEQLTLHTQFKILLCLFGVEIYSMTGCISIWQYLIVEHI